MSKHFPFQSGDVIAWICRKCKSVNPVNKESCRSCGADHDDQTADGS